MHKIQLFLFLIVTTCVASCHHRPVYPPMLHEADSMTYVAPRQAIQLLDSIGDEIAAADKPTRMYHQLLTVKAQDKAYITHTSDSVMLRLVDYYEHGGDKSLLPEAYYYMGSTYRDLNDAPRALDYYQKALDVMLGDQNLGVKSKVYAQMGDLFYYQDLYQEADKMYESSYRCDSILKDTVGIIYNLRDMALCCANLGRNEVGVSLLQQAILYADEIGDEEISSLTSSQLASLYIQKGAYELAYDAIKPSLSHLDSANISSVYSILASVHRHLNDKDSAYYYYNELLQFGNLYAQTEAYYQLAKIAEESLQTEMSISLLEQYRHLEDSLKVITETETMARMQSLYDYQLHEREKAEAQSRANKLQLYLITGIAIFAIVVLMLFSYGQYYKRKELKTKVRMEKLTALRQQEHQRSLSYIHENEEKIIGLTKRINELEGSETQLKVELENAKEQLVMENKMAEARMEQREQAVHAIHASSLRESLVKKAEASKHINEEDILSMEEFLNAIYPHFIEELKSLGRFNETEYRVSLLLKMKIAPKHICELVNRDKSTVSNIKRRLFVRFTGKPGSAKDWDDFVDFI